ncbi:MAG: SGNH/GDSL hydrolase family protein [Lentisphaerae bacterium]|nr:SGNH/GDSL hydrolase family protein [Lentisphaerota bacterium]
MSRDKCPVTPATRITFVAVVLIVVGVLVVLFGRRPPPVVTSFERAPVGDGWVYEEPRGEDIDDPWTDEVAASGTRSLSVERGHIWETPALDTDPLAYYRISFKSLAEVSSYLGIRFFDRQGELLTSDCFTEIEPSADWRDNEFLVRAHPLSGATRIMFQPMPAAGERGTSGRRALLYVDDVNIRAVRRQEAAAWADRVYAGLPPLAYTPRPGRWEFLPKTMAALRDGGVIRVVVLGDSIACDTANSAFDVLIERHYPAARLLVIPSTRRNTGCRHYLEEELVQAYVLDRRPDLLVIGGINNRGTGSILEMIRQVRDKSDTEILVMSGGFGINFMQQAAGRGQRSHPMSTVAGEEHVAFLDSGLILGKYLLSCGKPYEWFMRDQVHPNDRGKQLFGRILERYFAPDVD